MPNSDVQAILSLGSNVGDSIAQIHTAVHLLQQHGIPSLKSSSHYRTAPWGNTDQAWFINACVLVKTHLTPYELLDACLHVEHMMGRKREQKWAPRVIDIDIITYGEEVHRTQNLTIPHQHALERAFVLVPLFEICPALQISGIAIKDALAHVDVSGILKC